MNWRLLTKILIAMLAFFAVGVGFANPYRLGFWMILALVVLGWAARAIEEPPEIQGKKKKR